MGFNTKNECSTGITTTILILSMNHPMEAQFNVSSVTADIAEKECLIVWPVFFRPLVTNTGAPHGCVLGPLLYYLCTNLNTTPCITNSDGPINHSGILPVIS